MEGFWTVHFTGVQGWGDGVVTLIAGQVYGGDGGYLYTGTYAGDQNQLNAKLHIRQYAPGYQSVMGRSEFDLALTGTRNGDQIAVKGSIPGTPLAFQGSMTKRGNLPH
jgi:hypothetical protein